MNELIKQALVNILRVGVLWLLGVIAAKNPTIASFANSWITQHGGLDVVLLSVAGVILIWGQSLYTRMRMRLFAKQALRAEPGTTMANINKQIAAAPVSAVLTADPNKIE